MFKDVILKCRSFALNDDFFLKKSWSTSRSRWVAFLVAIYTKGRIETSVSLYLVSTVMTERDSRTVFCIVRSDCEFQKYLSTLSSNLS